MSKNTTQLKPRTVSLHASEFVRLADIFRAAGIEVELLRPYPPLPDPESLRERYRRETIERARSGEE